MNSRRLGGRWDDLVFMAHLCMISFGARIGGQLPNSLPNEFTEFLAANQTSKRLVIDSIYSWPNMALPLFGGLLVDSFLGLQNGTLIACIVIAVGSTFVSVAGSAPGLAGTEWAFRVTLAGWLLYGFGEVMYIGQQKFAAKRFGSGYFATALAVTNCFGQLCTALNFAVLPRVSREYGFGAALWVVTSTFYISVAACVSLCRIDQSSVKKVEEAEEMEVEAEAETGLEVEEEVEDSDEDDEARADGSQQPLLRGEQVLKPKTSVVGMVKELCVDIFGAREWLLCFLSVLLYAAISQFFSVGNKMLQVFYGMDEVDAAYLISLPFTIEAASILVMAYGIDKLGYPLVWLTAGASMLTVTHLSLAFAKPPALAAVLGLSIARTTISASFWPMIGYCVPERILGSSYGFIICFQNVGLSIAPLVVAQIVPDYVAIEICLSFISSVCVFLCVCLYFADRAVGGVLTSPNASTS